MLRQRQVLRVSTILAMVVLGGCSEQDARHDAQLSAEKELTTTPGGVPSSLRSPQDAGLAATNALNGDATAAAELVLYFLGERNDLEKARFWEQIAIENGHSGSLLTRGNVLISSEDPCLRLRGIFMLERALMDLMPAAKVDGNDWHQMLARAKDRTKNVSGESCLGMTTVPLSF